MDKEDIPIELDCWMLKWGILPREHMTRTPDVVWPVKKDERHKVSVGWKPSYEGEEPPF